jgi:hypothetical protein
MEKHGNMEKSEISKDNTNMKLKNILFATAVAALASCSSDNTVTETIIPVEPLDNPVELEVDANIAGTNTRVSGTKFSKGDLIGVTAVTTVTGGLTGGTNVQYTSQDENGHFTSTSPIYFKDKNAVNVYAYYPYSTIDSDGNVAVTTSAQTDYLYAKAEGVNYNAAALSMTFDHVMTKLSFTVTTGTGMDDLKDLDKLTIVGVTTAGKFNSVTGALTSTTTANYEISSFTASSDNKTKTASVMLFPMAKDATRQLTLQADYDGVTYTAKINATELLANYNYAYTVTLKRTGIEVSKSVITDWTNDTTNTDNNADAVIPTSK